jgi:hypothetical protein
MVTVSTSRARPGSIRPALTSLAQAWMSAKQLVTSQSAGRSVRNEPSSRPSSTSSRTRWWAAWWLRASTAGLSRGDLAIAAEFAPARSQQPHQRVQGRAAVRLGRVQHGRGPGHRPLHHRLQHRFGRREVRVDGDTGDTPAPPPRCSAAHAVPAGPRPSPGWPGRCAAR